MARGWLGTGLRSAERSNTRPQCECMARLAICEITEFLHPLIESGRCGEVAGIPGNLTAAAGSTFRPSRPHRARPSRHVGLRMAFVINQRWEVLQTRSLLPGPACWLSPKPRPGGHTEPCSPLPSPNTHTPAPSFPLSRRFFSPFILSSDLHRAPTMRKEPSIARPLGEAGAECGLSGRCCLGHARIQTQPLL